MNFEYQLTETEDQVTIEIFSINPLIESYTSEDGYLLITKVSGGSSGDYGYGTLTVDYDPRYLPLTLTTPNYENKQDLLDIIEKTNTNIAELNGNLLS